MDAKPSQSGRFDKNLSLARTSSSTSNKSTPESPRISTPSSSSYADSGSQSLASILNNPHVGKSGVYGSEASWVSGWWSSSSSAPGLPDLAPLVIKHPIPEVHRSDFQNYLSSISESYGRFEDIRVHSSREETTRSSEEEASLSSNFGVGQGEALVACLREVPSLYFKEDFALEEGPTFQAACPFSSPAENIALQEKLSQYLDTVEVHLVKEISLRSNSFFEAQGQLQGLNVEIVEACKRIRELKETIRLLNLELVDSARQVQDLNATRTNLITLQQKLTLILYVNQALSALKLLIAAADCSGALDIIDDLRHLLVSSIDVEDSDELAGLHCFRHLRDQLSTSIEDINRILSAEFMRSSIHDVGPVILSRLKAGNGNLSSVKDDFKLDEEEASSFRDRLLPYIIGLLRTKELPSELRNYREALTANMKQAIKTAITEMLPILVAPIESGLTTGERAVEADGGGASLVGKLRSLSSESFIRLLDAIFKVVQAHLVRAAEVKKAIEWIMCNLDSCYAADSNASVVALGAADAEGNHESSPYSLTKNGAKVSSVQVKSNDAPNPSNLSRNLRAEVLRENTEAVFAACDAAHGRWAKLLGIRALLHPKLRLQDFLSIYNITQDFITATEKIGGRLGYSIRGTLQSQCKSFVTSQHVSRMEKIKAVLDQETWASVDIPDEFQAIVDSLFSSEVSANGNPSEVHDSVEISEVVPRNDGSVVVDGEFSPQANDQDNSVESPADNTRHIKSSSSPGANQENKSETSTSYAPNNDSSIKKNARVSSQSLIYKGVGYHMVNCGLILLKMLSEYIQMNDFLPALSFEIVQRVVEILKFFNTRTCQLVLGAGAMQVSGLKSITSKHLALASQVISFVHAIIPDIRRVLFLRVPETFKITLLSEIDRVAQDYKVHRDEIHTKLVQIMRERLLVHLRGLPQIVEGWNRPEDNDLQPSQFARSLTKEVGFLQRVLSRTLHEVDVQAIFRQVVQIFHTQISEAFSNLEISTPQAKNRLHRDLQQILGCIRSLPTDIIGKEGVPNSGQLDEFLLQRFGTEAVK